MTFVFAGAADADIQVGDELCATAATGPTGEPIITESGVASGSGAGPATTNTGGSAMLPDTGTSGQPMSPILMGRLLLGAALGASASKLARQR